MNKKEGRAGERIGAVAAAVVVTTYKQIPNVTRIKKVHLGALDVSIGQQQEFVSASPDGHDQCEEHRPSNEGTSATTESCPVEKRTERAGANDLGDPVKDVVECSRPRGEKVRIDI